MVTAGIEKNRQDVIGVVHVGEATLLKRVKEFALTASSDLTAEDFEEHITRLEEQSRKSCQPQALPNAAPQEDSIDHIGCEHVLSESHSHTALCAYLKETQGES